MSEIVTYETDNNDHKSHMKQYFYCYILRTV